jgi:hypothetical protein
MHCWRRFAAILSMMTFRGARHRVAALHRLLRSCHLTTVEGIRRENEPKQSYQRRTRKTHPKQVRRVTWASQAQLPCFKVPKLFFTKISQIYKPSKPIREPSLRKKKRRTPRELTPYSIGGYVSYFPAGILIWLITANE